MTTKIDLRRLAAKGMTGKEAGRLAVAHLLAIQRGHTGILSASDIEGLRACLRDRHEGDDYQRMVGLYQAAQLMIAEAQIASLQTVIWLEEMIRAIERYAVTIAAAELLVGISAGERRRALAEHLECLHCSACRPASVLLAYQQVLSEMGVVARVSLLCGILPLVPFELWATLPEAVEQQLLDFVQAASRDYNALAQDVAERCEGEEPLALPPFELEKIEPFEAALVLLRERVALGNGGPGLGPEWWLGRDDG